MFNSQFLSHRNPDWQIGNGPCGVQLVMNDLESCNGITIYRPLRKESHRRNIATGTTFAGVFLDGPITGVMVVALGRPDGVFAAFPFVEYR
jgi:hypothetical protein